LNSILILATSSSESLSVVFKIRTRAADRQGSEFTSQLYFDDAITDRVHAQAPYAAKGQRTQKNDRDGIFGEGGEQLLLQLTKVAAGYEGRFNIGLEQIYGYFNLFRSGVAANSVMPCQSVDLL
jgi:hypothetical protein